MASEVKSEPTDAKAPCGGRRCQDCGQCSDWFYTGGDWNHVRSWRSWCHEDWMRYGEHVVNASKNRASWSCSRNCPVAGYYQWQYHTGSKWNRHDGSCHKWGRREGATCTCPTNLPGYGYSRGGVYEGCLHHHNRDYGPWCMCKNNTPSEYFNVETSRRDQFILDAIETRSKDSSDED